MSELSGEVRKRCSRCSRELPTADFHRASAGRDGLQAWCRECANAYKREKRARKLKRKPIVPTGMKWCRRCEAVKPLDDFDPHARTTDGRQTYCKKCCADLYRKRRLAQGLLARPQDIPEGHKFCRSCERVLPLAAWAARKNSTDGFHFRCKECSATAERADYFARTYGLTLEDVERMLAEQGGRCAICLTAEAVHVDHDHETGHVRGMLCFPCNAALGQLGDRLEVLRRALAYLARHSPDGRVRGESQPSLIERELGLVLSFEGYGHAS